MLEKRVSVQGITEYALPNGLKVLLLPDPSQATVTVNLTIFAGSACESYGETGAAHLLEHLAFQGSPDFENVPAALNEHGATWNGTTWNDRTNYYETMPASDENLEFGIHFEAARLMRSYIRKEDLDSEMTVVRNEYEAGENSPLGILSERMVSTAFLFHGYGHATIGARSDIEGVPIERLKRFYRTWYRPDNALLVIAGRFDEAKAKDGIVRHFGPLERPGMPVEIAHTVEPPQDGERSVSLRRVGEVGAAGVVYHIPAASHPDMASIEVLADILTTTPSGRLYKSLVETKKAVRVSAYVFMFRDPSLIEIVTEVRKDGSLHDVRDELLETVEAFSEAGPTDEEVERAKNALLKERTLVFANSERLAIELSEWAAMGDWRLFFVHRDRLEAVAAGDVARVAGDYLRTSNRTVGVYYPVDKAERTEVPAVEDPSASIAAHDLSDESADGEIDALSIDGVVLEERTTRGTYCEGRVRYALLPKRTRGSLVSGRLSFPVGNADSLPLSREINDYVATLLERGTTSRDRTKLKDDLDRLRADVRIFGGTNDTSFAFTTTRPNLVEVVRLLCEVMREPTFAESELDLLREEKLAEIEEATRDPFALASLALEHHLYPEDHARYSTSLEEQRRFLEGLTRDDLVGFHADYYGAKGMDVAVVGDFDVHDVGKLLEAEFDGWSSRKSSVRLDVNHPASGPVRHEQIETPDKENALTVAGRTMSLRLGNPRCSAFGLANYMIGGEALNSRISQRLRQKEGLCYGAGSSAAVELTGDLGTFTFWAISAPQNAERVEVGFREELERARVDGFTKEELERARRAYLDLLEVRLSRDAAMAGEMIDHMVRAVDFGEIEAMRERLRGVELDDVNSITMELLDPATMSLFRAGDFANAKKTEEAAIG